jgi:hypothetical protein
MNSGVRYVHEQYPNDIALKKRLAIVFAGIFRQLSCLLKDIVKHTFEAIPNYEQFY